jgi:hypothetical protein
MPREKQAAKIEGHREVGERGDRQYRQRQL